MAFLRRWFLRGALLAAVGVAVWGGTVAAWPGAPDQRISRPTAPGSGTAGPKIAKDRVLSWPLVELARAQQAAAAAGHDFRAQDEEALPKPLRDLLAAELMYVDGAGRVQVYVEANGDTSALLAPLLALDVKIDLTAAKYGLTQAWVPIQQLDALGATRGVRQVRLPDYAITQVGSVTTEGDALLNAPAARSTLGIDGSGVRVGVVSNGVEGLAASQASGDLPSVNTGTCDFGPGLPTDPGAGAEGTAMLEIVHDIAPGAELWYGFSGGTSMGFMAAVDCLADNVDVIVDDVYFLNVGPYDGTSDVSQNTSDSLGDPTNRVRGYYNAVGNSAQEHYQGVYVDSGFVVSGFWDAHLFSGTPGTDEGELTPPCGCADSLWLPPGFTLEVELQWNDAWGASGNDYTLLMYANGIPIPYLQGVQNGDDLPVEHLVYTNPTPAMLLIHIYIGNLFGAAAPRTFDMFVVCKPVSCAKLTNNAGHNFNTPCSSVPNNSDAGGGVVSLGAIAAGDPGLDTFEPFSSCGPTNDLRLKPDAAAVDGVCVTGAGGFGEGTCQGTGKQFIGTSAAAPHAAGIAALLLDCNPALTRAQLREALLSTAVDLGPPGLDYDFVYGRLNALAAATGAGCVQPPATPTPTRSATPTHTLEGPSATATRTPTPTGTGVPASTATYTSEAPGPTPTYTVAAPATLTFTPTNTPTVEEPATAVATPTRTRTATATRTRTRTPTRTPTPAAGARGDATCDGVANSLDSLYILQFYAALLRALPCPQNADVNRDGVIDARDSLLILQLDAGLIHALPAGAPGGWRARSIPRW